METRRKILSVTMADCDLYTMKATGPGGQNVNKRETAVRIVHRASGAVGECREERSQLANKRRAWRRMYEDPKFQLWLRRALGQEMVRESEVGDIPETDLKIEVKQGGRWVQVPASSLSM